MLPSHALLAALLLPAAPATAGLKDHSDRLIGAALSRSFLQESAYAFTAAREFNYVTPENETKWAFTEPSPGRFTFSAADAIVEFAESQGMKVKGHTLVWHELLASYVNDTLTPDELRSAVETHIAGVVGHYRGRMYAWDVVNEAIDDSTGDLRDTIFLRRLGPGYIAEAFRLAHEADPDALLFYNDYGVEGPTRKSDAMYALVKGLLADGVPIHGVGLQMHVAAGEVPPGAAPIKANMQRFADLGLLVNVSEMDVRIRNVLGDRATRLATQARVYHDVVAACVAVPLCHAVTFWGFTDAHSWVDGFFGADDPLLFDEQYNPKPAYFGVGRALDPAFPPCADGTSDPGEQCDDGNLTDGDGCDSSCTVTACGNGIATPGEACDDGNTIDADGCEARCRIDCATKVTNPKLVVGNLLLPGGDDVLTFQGKVTLPVPRPAALDPFARGLRVTVSDSSVTRIDLTVTSGAFSTASGRGWKVNKAGTKWTFIDKGVTPAYGIFSAVIQDKSASVPGLVTFNVKARAGSYGVSAGDLALAAALVLDPPTGLCGHADFAGTFTKCSSNRAGSKLTCK